MSIDLFDKQPYIQKILKKYVANGEQISEFSMRHLHFLMNAYKQDIKIVKPAYNQFQSFKELYQSIVKITGANSKHRFSDHFSKADLIAYCHEHNLEYTEQSKQVIVVSIQEFKHMKDLGSIKWCITRSPKDFANYTVNHEQYIVFNFNERHSGYYRVGITKGNVSRVFDNHNSNITHHYLSDTGQLLNSANSNKEPRVEKISTLVKKSMLLSEDYIILEFYFILLISFLVGVTNIEPYSNFILEFLFILFFTSWFWKICMSFIVVKKAIDKKIKNKDIMSFVVSFTTYFIVCSGIILMVFWKFT